MNGDYGRMEEFTCESSSVDSDEVLLDPNAPPQVSRDPLFGRSTEWEAQRQEVSPGQSGVPLLDMTQNSTATIRYVTTSGRTQEGLFELTRVESGRHQSAKLVFQSAECPRPSPRNPHSMVLDQRSKQSHQPEMSTAVGAIQPTQEMGLGNQMPIDQVSMGYGYQIPVETSTQDMGYGRQISYNYPQQNQPTMPMGQGRMIGQAGVPQMPTPVQPIVSHQPPTTSLQKMEIDKTNVPEEKVNLDDGNGGRVAIRQYQLDLYRSASRSNVIAYLDTGSGKTFISVLLIRDMATKAANLRRVADVPKKSIFFLVPRKVLVHQQGAVLKQFTDLVVSEHSGDRFNEDIWDKQQWDVHITRADVMVMTPQILVNMLRRQIVHITGIQLIVFDEAHHTRKNNPYNCIMQEFYHPAKRSGLPTPKIFGMTASLVTRKRSLEEVCNSFVELEENLDARIMTTRDESLRRFATNAIEVDVPYSVDMTQMHLPMTFHLIERATTRLSLANRLSLNHHIKKLGSKNWQIDSKKQKGPLEQQTRQLGNVQHVIGVMGLLPACSALAVIIDGWNEKGIKSLSNWDFPTAVLKTIDLTVFDDRIVHHPSLRDEPLGSLSTALHLSLMDMIVAILVGLYRCEEQEARRMVEDALGTQAMSMRLIQKTIKLLSSKIDLKPLRRLTCMPVESPQFDIPPNPDSPLLSHRMEQLFRFLIWVKSRLGPEEEAEWRGMIFVEQTLMALVFEDVLRLNPDLNFFKCQSLTGHNSSLLSAAMEDTHQRQIVQMFRSGKVNLLICTSVAEEGLDIAQCSMVVRFNRPPTEASYIQSRGRARKPGSLYAMFFDQDDIYERVELDNLRFAEQCMKAFAGERHQRQEELDDDFMSGTREADEEIALSETMALMARNQGLNEIGKNVAIDMLYSYIHQLPQDGYCQLRPHLIYRSRETNRLEFQYKLTMPANAPITQPILGEWEPSKKKAKQSVCYVACIELRNLGELDRSFNPVRTRAEAKEKRRSAKAYNETISVETPIESEILKPDRSAMDLSSMGQPCRRILHLNVATIAPQLESGSIAVQ